MYLALPTTSSLSEPLLSGSARSCFHPLAPTYAKPLLLCYSSLELYYTQWAERLSRYRTSASIKKIDLWILLPQPVQFWGNSLRVPTRQRTCICRSFSAIQIGSEFERLDDCSGNLALHGTTCALKIMHKMLWANPLHVVQSGGSL